MIRLLGKTKLAGKQGLVFILGIFFFFIFLFSSCSNPAGLLGTEIQPEDSKLNLRFTDTTSIYGYSEIYDSLRTDYLARNSIGSLYDPVFGVTVAGVYLQVIPVSANHDFGEPASRKLDSLVLQLRYSGSYGDTVTPLTFHSYQLAEKYDFDTAYYSDSKIAINPTDYSNYTFLPTPSDSTIVGKDTIAPSLRLTLNNNDALGEYLLKATPEQMKDAETFLEYFYGLAVVAEPEMIPGEGSLLYFDILNSLSRMTLYYRNEGEDGFEDTLSFSYGVPTFAGRVNRYSHDYELGEYDLRQQILPPFDTALGDKKLYTQGFAGVKIKLNIPNMRAWNRLGKVAINEAKLILPGYEENPLWPAPTKMNLYELGEDGNYVLLPDAGEGDVFFGGSYKSGSNSYTFRITRYLQSLIDDSTKVNYGLALFNRDPWINPNSFVFAGPHPEVDTAKRLKIEVLYTLLEE